MLDRGSAPQWPQAALPHLARLTTLGELTVLIAHELSQPLAAIAANGRASLQWLNEPTLGVDKARTSVQAMVNSAHRAGQIIQRLRALSRKAEMGESLLLVNDVIDDVVPLVAAEMQSNGVTLQMDLARELPLVLGDRVQLQQVVLNLVMNGIEAMSSVDDRTLQLRIRSARHDPNQVVVAVADSGAGIDPQVIGRIFEPFYTTKPPGRGTGLGLSICDTIIADHGGRIEVDSALGAGSTFRIVLPAAEATPA